jgi:Leucine Rich repeat
VQLLAAFQTNRTVTDLGICRVHNLEDALLGASLSGLAQNMTQLQRLDCRCCRLRSVGIRAFLLPIESPGVRFAITLKELCLSSCELGDEGIRLIADALVGNTTIEILSIQSNGITSVSLAEISRICESTTRLQTIDFGYNHRVFDNENATQHFARFISRSGILKTLAVYNVLPLPAHAFASIFQALESNTVLEELSLGQLREQSIDQLIQSLPQMKNIKVLNCRGVFNLLFHAEFWPALHRNTSLQVFAGFTSNPQRLQTHQPSVRNDITVKDVSTILTRNHALHHANAILQPSPHPERRGMVTVLRLHSGVWQEAIVKLATRNPFGSSAIFHILQQRPGLLEPRLPRPPSQSHAAGATGSSSQGVVPLPPQGTTGQARTRRPDIVHSPTTTTTTDNGRKRRRRL